MLDKAIYWLSEKTIPQLQLPILTALAEEACAENRASGFTPKVESLKTGQTILAAEPALQAHILASAFFLWCSDYRPAPRLDHPCSRGHPFLCNTVLYLLAECLFRKRLPFSAKVLTVMVQAASKTILYASRPLVAPLLNIVERHVEENGLDAKLRKALVLLLRQESSDAGVRRLQVCVSRIVDGNGETTCLVLNAWGQDIKSWLANLSLPERRAWTALLQHAVTVALSGRPSEKWLMKAAALVRDVGEGAFPQRLEEWLHNVEIDPSDPEANTDLIRGLIWVSATLESERLGRAVGRFCEACYRKEPGFGPADVGLGNACIHALGAMTGEHALAELIRLRSRIKFNQGRKQLDKVIGAAAERVGLSVEDVEEMALPDFGLDLNGSLRESVGDSVAEIQVTGFDDVMLRWIGADGKPRKSVPVAVKAEHTDEIRELRARVKAIKGLLSGHRWRLEGLYLQKRRWSLSSWRERYLEHPLLSHLSRRLIWRFDGGDQSVTAIPVNDGLIGVDGQPIVWPGETTEISLWHPIDASSDQVLAWRQRLAELDITQPFKQAHREIYPLTDAEWRSDIYSNRFAAHIIKQHQFNALCQARAWHYSLRGAWDKRDSVPTRLLPNWRLKAEFWLDAVEGDQQTYGGVYLYLATDQVRFLDAHDQVLHLAEVPPLVFSEVMRDVDLFVGVASVGNDPTWQDGGPEGRHRDYWWGYSFGELCESAKTRHEVLQGLIPKLTIAERCALEDKFLCVRGSKRSYKIHLGSGNILMEPNGKYLCIVKGWDKAADKQKIRLPFEGDSTLSLILSKAFLLAADDKITDKTILSQIKS